MFQIDNTSRIGTWTTAALIYINDLSHDLTTNIKVFFADVRSLFSTAHKINAPAINLNNGLNKLEIAIQRGTNFNPDPSYVQKSSGSYIFKKASKDKR